MIAQTYLYIKIKLKFFGEVSTVVVIINITIVLFTVRSTPTLESSPVHNKHIPTRSNHKDSPSGTLAGFYYVDNFNGI